MKKLLVCMGLCLAFMATPAVAAVNLGLPINTQVNFDGNGVFAQTVFPVDGQGNPLPPPAGTELFGAGTISDVALASDPGTFLWVPPAGMEMTFVVWDAVVTSATSSVTGSGNIIIEASYADGARILLVEDWTPDYTSAAGPGAFDLVDGEFPTAYTLEDAGYNSDGAPDAGSMFLVPDDAGESVFLDLQLNSNNSTLTWNPTLMRFVGGQFTSDAVEILGGGGANQFSDFTGADGAATGSLLINLPPPGAGWAFPSDLDITLTTIPEPASMIFLGTGLASLLGYGLRRKMS